jgi:hypothetical protein
MGGMSDGISSSPDARPCGIGDFRLSKVKNRSKQSSKISFSAADFARVAPRLLLTTRRSPYPHRARACAASMLSDTDTGTPAPRRETMKLFRTRSIRRFP